MFPPSISTGTESPGEIDLFNKLKNDPITQNWIILHSLDIANHKRQISGEADFVIIVPNKGILYLEVKASTSVRRENGLWFLGTKPPEKRGPFKQASLAMHSLQENLWKKDGTLKNIVFWSAVIFPYVNFEIESPEWHTWQALDAEQYRTISVGQLVLEVLNKARSHLVSTPSAKWFDPRSCEPTEKQVYKIAQLLRPSFEFYESPESRSQRRIKELKFYTEEQFIALDAMSNNPRVIFTGPAGTGKTFLAIELARRKSIISKKVLFLCFNRLLGEWLQQETQTLNQQVRTSTLHSHMLAVSDITPIKGDSSFWNIVLPQIAIESISNDGKEEYIYDVLIIDEAQDILSEYFIEFLEASVRGGLSCGNCYYFGDFERQVIYQNNPEDIIRSKLSHFPKFNLRINCRNTPRIAEFVHILGGLNPGYSRIRRPDNFIEPEIHIYSNNDDQYEKLYIELEKLVKYEKYSGSDIVILSPKSDVKSMANKLTGKENLTVKPIYALTSKNQIAFSSIHSFKGLESPVIVLTDIEDIKSEQAKSLFYTAITRAIEKLIILVNDDAREDLLELITLEKHERRNDG